MNKNTVRAVVRQKHVTKDLDLAPEEVSQLLELAHEVKRSPARYADALSGRYISLLFEKPSLRTRLTFELAIKQLGGDSIFSEGPVGGREPVKDVARNLDRWTNGIVARTFSQETIEELARWSKVPVINALSDLYHPCQALADVFTLKEQFGELRGLKLAFVGDGNNVAHSLMLTAARLGVNVAVATPPGYEPERRRSSARPGVSPRLPGPASRSPTTSRRPSRAPTRSTPTCGPAWARKARRRSACGISAPIR